MKQKKNLHSVILATTLVPLVFLGIVIMIFSYQNVKKTLDQQKATELKFIGYTIIEAFDTMYPGEYQLVGETSYELLKGDHVLNAEYDFIDKIKENTGMDVSLFYLDTRILTTIFDEEGTRIVGTGANQAILADVLFNGEEAFYTNGVIGGQTYFSYYIPLKNQLGSHVGMLSVSQPTSVVYNDLWKFIRPILFICILGMLFAALIAIRQANNLYRLIKQIQLFLSQVATGNLSASIQPETLKRNDEFGEMARNAVHMQRSLREFIEHDALTGLYNRRFSDKYLETVNKKAIEKGSGYYIAIADIDFFKKVNDTYGHDCGDLVLVTVAAMIQEKLAPYGFASRWGGEEFLLVFDKCSGETVLEVLEDLRLQVKNHTMEYGDQHFHVTMTFGVVESDTDKPVEEMFKQADEKLYYGKQNGRNQVVFKLPQSQTLTKEE